MASRGGAQPRLPRRGTRPERPPRRGPSCRHRRTALLGLVLAVAIARLSRQVPLNSDQASSVLEGWAMATATCCWALDPPLRQLLHRQAPPVGPPRVVPGADLGCRVRGRGLLGAGVVLVGIWLAGGRLRGRTRAVAMVVTGALLASQALLLPEAVPPSCPAPAARRDRSRRQPPPAAGRLPGPPGRRRSRAWLVLAWLALAAASIGIAGGGRGGGAVAGWGPRPRGRAASGHPRRSGADPHRISSAVAAPVTWWRSGV